MTLSFAVDLLLWGGVGALMVMLGLRSRRLLWEAVYDGFLDFLRLIPRLGFGVIGAGFLAEVLPQGLIASLIGPGSGFTGVAIATVVGMLAPGGPVVGFAIAATALKAGGAAPQVIAFVSAWSLFALQRLLMWEMPVMEPSVVRVRIIASLPLPFLAAGIAMIVGHP